MSLSFPLIPLSTLAYFRFYLLFSSLFLYLSLTPLFSQEMVEIFPSQDNILYESSSGHLSNGAGQYIFAGRTGQNNNGKRRAMLQFDLQSLPSNAIVEEAELTLYSAASSSVVPNSFHLHRVQQSWGEGNSDDDGNEGSGIEASGGDVTWLHRYHDSLLWENAGGDFLTDTSAISSVDTIIGFKTWSDSNMLVDINYWLAHPDSNYGWVMIGDETTKSTARRFGSRTHPDSTIHPRLVIRYSRSTNFQKQSGSLNFHIFPNPTKKNITLQLPENLTQVPHIRAFDTRGKLIYQQTLPQVSSSISFQLPTVPTGLYWIEMRSGYKRGVKKVLIVE